MVPKDHSRSETTIRYLVTISCQQKKEYIDRLMLDEVIRWLKMNVDHLSIIRSVYENSGKYRQLHWHAIISVPKNFYYRPYTAYGDLSLNMNTYRVQYKKIYDIKGAYKYINKDLRYKTQIDILQNNYYSIYRLDQKNPTYIL